MCADPVGEGGDARVDARLVGACAAVAPADDAHLDEVLLRVPACAGTCARMERGRRSGSRESSVK
eukprot:1628929-Pleurochrysis_carterae.AAC.1